MGRKKATKSLREDMSLRRSKIATVQKFVDDARGRLKGKNFCQLEITPGTLDAIVAIVTDAKDANRNIQHIIDEFENRK